MNISESESVVMAVLWRETDATAEAIINEVATAQGWKAATVKTLLNRLLTKGAVTARKDGRRYVYSTTLARRDYVFERSKDLIDRLFNGRVAPFVSQLSEQESLSKEDIAELKLLLDRLGDDG